MEGTGKVQGTDAFWTDVLDILNVPGCSATEVMLPHLSSQAELESFSRRFDTRFGFTRITRANARSLYQVAVGLEPSCLDGLSNQLAPDKLNAALRVVGAAHGWEEGSTGRTYMSAFLAGYTLETNEMASADLAVLFALPISFHLTPDMARSVYVTATTERGAEYCEEAWRGLDNRQTPAKLTKALELAGVDVAAMEIDFKGMDGYMIKTSAELVEQLDALHHHITQPSAPASGGGSPAAGAMRGMRGMAFPVS